MNKNEYIKYIDCIKNIEIITPDLLFLDFKDLNTDRATQKTILELIKNGIDISWLSHPDFDSRQKEIIADGLFSGIDVSIYANPKIDYNVMKIMSIMLKNNLNDFAYLFHLLHFLTNHNYDLENNLENSQFVQRIINILKNAEFYKLFKIDFPGMFLIGNISDIVITKFSDFSITCLNIKNLQKIISKINFENEYFKYKHLFGGFIDVIYYLIIFINKFGFNEKILNLILKELNQFNIKQAPKNLNNLQLFLRYVIGIKAIKNLFKYLQYKKITLSDFLYENSLFFSSNFKYTISTIMTILETINYKYWDELFRIIKPILSDSNINLVNFIIIIYQKNVNLYEYIYLNKEKNNLLFDISECYSNLEFFTILYNLIKQNINFKDILYNFSENIINGLLKILNKETDISNYNLSNSIIIAIIKNEIKKIFILFLEIINENQENIKQIKDILYQNDIYLSLKTTNNILDYLEKIITIYNILYFQIHKKIDKTRFNTINLKLLEALNFKSPEFNAIYHKNSSKDYFKWLENSFEKYKQTFLKLYNYNYI